mmetsp:Transcript_10703/g.30321  ORF Transcript_10703/g.30321 Transcript_10703/m.30321 type:complete len:223 (-) Transcript_10703:807-1475(-)
MVSSLFSYALRMSSISTRKTSSKSAESPSACSIAIEDTSSCVSCIALICAFAACNSSASSRRSTSRTFAADSILALLSCTCITLFVASCSAMSACAVARALSASARALAARKVAISSCASNSLRRKSSASLRSLAISSSVAFEVVWSFSVERRRSPSWLSSLMQRASTSPTSSSALTRICASCSTCSVSFASSELETDTARSRAAASSLADWASLFASSSLL